MLTWHKPRWSCVCSYAPTRVAMAVQGRDQRRQIKLEHGKPPAKATAEAPAGTNHSGQRAAKQHSTGTLASSKQADAPGSKRKRPAGATAPVSKRAAVSRQDNPAGCKRRRAADAAGIAGAEQAQPRARLPIERKAPHGTWLTLPEMPAMAADGAPWQKTPALSIHGPAVGTSAAVRGVAATQNGPHGRQMKPSAAAAKATCAALKAPSTNDERPSRKSSCAAACGGAAAKGNPRHNKRPRCSEAHAGATGTARRIAPCELENRLIAGFCTPAVVGAKAVPSAPLEAQPAGSPGPQPAGLRSPSAPSQIGAAATMLLRQSFPPQLRADVSLHGGGGRSAEQRPNTSGASTGGVLAAAVRRPPLKCRFCAVHGVYTAITSSHRQACKYLHHCGCTHCRKLHLQNQRSKEGGYQRKAAAARKAAATV